MNASIESLNWSSLQHGVRTARGVRSLRTAPATQAWWAVWRQAKNDPTLMAEIKAAGYECKPTESGGWEVRHWLKPDDATALRPTATLPVEARALTERQLESEATTTVTEAIAAVFKANPAVDPKHGGINWTDEQVNVLNWFAGQYGPGNLAIDAVAGSGKTFTVTHGISVAPEQEILYLVFNKKNQREADRKITDSRVTVQTLNACGARCVSQVWRGTQWDDTVEADRIERVHPDIHSDALSSVQQLVAFAKNTFICVPTVEQLIALADQRDIFCSVQDPDGNEEYPVAKLADIAQRAMKAATVRDGANRASFNDQVWLPVVMGWVRPSYDLVVVDETQDMNAPQLAMVQKLVRKGGRTCIVGDPFQAIYGFRGAVQDGMGLMIRALSARTLPLTISQRCSKAVGRVATGIVPHFRTADAAVEGAVLATDQVQLLNIVKIGDAILSRVNAPLMSTCLQLLKKGIPARIEGRDVGKALLAIVNKLNAKSVPDFMKRLARWEDKQTSRLKNTKNPETKLAAVRDTRETLEAVAEGCANVSEITSRILSLFQNSDDKGVKPAVVLSSVHKAKGLEWDNTYLLSWTFNKRKPKNAAEAQEEANIYYVAATRARHTMTSVAEGGQPANTVAENKDGTKAGAI